jgi:hypothetical protein
VFAGPRNGNRINRVTPATSITGNGSNDLGCELHRVEVSPSPLRRRAFASGFTETVGARKPTSPMMEQNPHLVFSQIKVNLVDHPRVIETD